MKCIIHYKNQSKYSNIKELSEDNKNRITAAKQLRESLGGDDHHEDQCCSVPETFSDIHGIHLEPCYRKYEIIYSLIL